MREIRFEKPAEKWDEAFPIGNGRMGAMIFGQTGAASGECVERIQLNQDSIWYGGPQNRYNPAAKEYIEEIRKLILEEENVAGAEKLMRYTMSGIPQGERPYQTGGDLHITWECEKESEYYRTLDLEEGIVKVYAKVGENEIRKEYLASFPEQVMAVKITASKPGSLNGAALLTREKFYKTVTPVGKNGIKLWGRCGDDGVHFATGVKAETVGGSVQVIGEHLIVRDADEVTFYIGMETSFYEPENWEEVLEKRLEGALEKGYETIRREHVEDYRNLYARVKLQIGSEEENDEELKYVMDYFQFGRYLCIAASRPGSLPANLQGIWNEFILPPWDSKYTININTEMNYWPVEGCNLSECHLPLFDLLKRMWKRGQTVAREMYGCRGFVAHHNTDMWADCAPQDICNPATYWVMGAAWLCTHIWKHYLYTQDREFWKKCIR